MKQKIKKNSTHKEMTKDKCDSSTESEVCYKVKCEDKCKDQNCDIKKCPCYRPEELVCMYKDAVVEVHSEFILFDVNGVTGATPQETPIRVPGETGETAGRQDVILEGNGFFIKGHYIVTPAHLVLMPPSLTSTVDRFPFMSGSTTDLTTIQNQMVRASRILVSVFNVNGNGHSFVYEADLVGVDGAGDIAVLKINYKKQWNLCNPCVEKCHPVLKFGKSREAKDGERVYLLGDYVTYQGDTRLFNAAGAISEGLLSDHRYVDYSGWALQELVLVSASAYAFSSGMPILNCQGRVIAMQTTDVAGVNAADQAEGNGFVSGPSEFFMRRVIKVLLSGCCRRQCEETWAAVVQDAAGAYLRYTKAYLGLAYDLFTGSMYDVTREYLGTTAAATGAPRIRLDDDGNFLTSPSCKELVGIRVLGIAGANPTDDSDDSLYYVPGGGGTGPLVGTLPVSPFLGRLQEGDVITHINCLPLGDLHKQIAPSLITWRIPTDCAVEIHYRRGGNSPNSSLNDTTSNYEQSYIFSAFLSQFPEVMDYPWYAVRRFPNLTDLGWTLASGQIAGPQYPALAAGAPFHAAL